MIVAQTLRKRGDLSNLFKWLRKFSRDPDPLTPLGFEPQFFESGKAPSDSVTVSIENDDDTTLEFVVQVLREYFGFTTKRAVEIALKIHNEGSAETRVVGIADAKHLIQKIRQEAEHRGFPLKLSASPAVRS